MNFEAWFIKQFGGVPNAKKVESLERKKFDLEGQLSLINEELRQQERLSGEWTAALYAAQAFEGLSKRGAKP